LIGLRVTRLGDQATRQTLLTKATTPTTDVFESVNSTVKLAVALAATWLFLAAPAWVVGGANAVLALSLAAWLCFVPHLMILAFGFVFQSRDRSLSGLLAGMATRLVVVLAGAAMICWYRTDLRGAMFLVWLAPCYFVALAVETRILVARAGGMPRARHADGSSVTPTPSGG
jgi:hypothetical protein